MGAVAWRPGQVVDVDRVMVDPSARRRGIAAALVQGAALDAAGHAPVETSTGRDNSPGIALYRRFGFEPVADEQAPTGVWLTRLRRG